MLALTASLYYFKGPLQVNTMLSLNNPLFLPTHPLYLYQRYRKILLIDKVLFSDSRSESTLDTCISCLILKMNQQNEINEKKEHKQKKLTTK